jgi:hypothetical protein
LKNKSVDKIVFKEIRETRVFHYALESFCEENRSMTKKTVPCTVEESRYVGVYEPPQTKWQVEIQPKQSFIDETRVIVVPKSERVKKCSPTSRCWSCLGLGLTRCNKCDGTGRRPGTPPYNPYLPYEYKKCTGCGGSKKVYCKNCNGFGKVQCKKCEGLGLVRKFLSFEINWKNHRSEYLDVNGEENFPKKLIKEASGMTVFEKKGRDLETIGAALFTSKIEQKSAKFIEEHNKNWSGTKLLDRRQYVIEIPMAVVTYNSKNKQGEFYCYGKDEYKIFFPSYPDKNCILQ